MVRASLVELVVSGVAFLYVLELVSVRSDWLLVEVGLVRYHLGVLFRAVLLLRASHALLGLHASSSLRGLLLSILALILDALVLAIFTEESGRRRSASESRAVACRVAGSDKRMLEYLVSVVIVIHDEVALSAGLLAVQILILELEAVQGAIVVLVRLMETTSGRLHVLT